MQLGLRTPLAWPNERWWLQPEHLRELDHYPVAHRYENTRTPGLPEVRVSVVGWDQLASWVTRVVQLLKSVRVLPQLPTVATHSSNVQVDDMYSAANQRLVPAPGTT